MSLRALLGAGLLWAGRRATAGSTIAAIYLVAFFSDIADGVIARRLGCATLALRKADSTVDTFFHLCLAWLVWRTRPEIVAEHRAGLLFVFATGALWYAHDALRFRQLAGFHTWSAKAFAVAIAVWVVSIFVDGPEPGAGSVALGLGVLAHLEGLAISLVLRERVADMPTLLHALRASRRDLGR